MARTILIEDLDDEELARGAASLLESGKAALRSGDKQMAKLFLALSLAIAVEVEAVDSSIAEQAMSSLDET